MHSITPRDARYIKRELSSSKEVGRKEGTKQYRPVLVKNVFKEGRDSKRIRKLVVKEKGNSRGRYCLEIGKTGLGLALDLLEANVYFSPIPHHDLSTQFG